MSALSFDALVPIVRARWRGSKHISHIGDAGRAATVLGIDRRTAHRWRHKGLTPPVADEMATRLGLHPVEVWGDIWWEASEHHKPHCAGCGRFRYDTPCICEAHLGSAA